MTSDKKTIEEREMPDFSKVCLIDNKVKWYERLWLWAVPTYEVLEGDNIHYFKYAFGRTYYYGENRQ